MTVERIKCTMSYDGSQFSGYQIQVNARRTVQGEFERSLAKVHKKQYIETHGSGRTDKGVHAVGQTLHFDTPLVITEDKWKMALNTVLPADIYVHRVEKVASTFHARYDAVTKEYRYYIWNERETDVFKRHYMYQYRYPLDIDRMQEACRYLQGEHDFTSFSSAKATTSGSKVRTMYYIACRKQGSEIEVIFRGSGFLYNMARIMVGVLLDVGTGKIEPTTIPTLLAKKDRRVAGVTAPSQGLYLWEVIY